MIEFATYFAIVTVLFFFWVYGIVAFARDLKGTYIPKARQYVRGRREQKEQAEKEREREQKERQLY